MPADRPENVVERGEVVVTPAVVKKRLVFEAIVSTDDTITLGDLSTINSAHLAKKSDGSEVACTILTNVITVTGVGLTDIPVVGFAIGV